jgi:hypothetical protein
MRGTDVIVEKVIVDNIRLDRFSRSAQTASIPYIEAALTATRRNMGDPYKRCSWIFFVSSLHTSFPPQNGLYSGAITLSSIFRV